VFSGKGIKDWAVRDARVGEAVGSGDVVRRRLRIV